MSDTEFTPVVVGADGSEEALVAVEWAARQARRLERPLRVVHAFEWPEFNVRLGPPPGAPLSAGLLNEALRIVAEAQQRARDTDAEITVDGGYVEGFRRPVLIAETRKAHLIVVGSRGLGGVGSLLIGSTGIELAARSECPVVVVPQGTTPAPGEDLVAAVDCSESSRPALEFALGEAAVRGVGLRVLLALQGEGLRAALSSTEPPADQEPTKQAARSRLARFTAPLRERHPEVPVDERVVRASPRQLLIEESATTELLVVGSRGYGGFKGLLLGSVSQSVLHHARCPVAVIPSPR